MSRQFSFFIRKYTGGLVKLFNLKTTFIWCVFDAGVIKQIVFQWVENQLTKRNESVYSAWLLCFMFIYYLKSELGSTVSKNTLFTWEKEF